MADIAFDVPADDDVIAAVRAAAHGYERDLVAGDHRAAAAWFDLDDPAVSRFAPDGEQLDATAVVAARAANASVAAPEWLVDDVRVLADGVALHLALLRRGEQLVQRSQVWVHRPGGWRITHAHVSPRRSPGTMP